MKKKYLDESEMKITELAAEEMTKYPAGTLLMVVRSGILKRMLPLCILTQESTINQDIKAYRLFDSSISEYVYYMLKGLETHILENYRKQVTTVDSLKFDDQKKCWSPFHRLLSRSASSPGWKNSCRCARD